MAKLTKYRVTIEETATYIVEVEAEDKDSAAVIAVDRLIDTNSGKYLVAVTERDVLNIKVVS